MPSTLRACHQLFCDHKLSTTLIALWSSLSNGLGCLHVLKVFQHSVQRNREWVSSTFSCFNGRNCKIWKEVGCSTPYSLYCWGMNCSGMTQEVSGSPRQLSPYIVKKAEKSFSIMVIRYEAFPSLIVLQAYICCHRKQKEKRSRSTFIHQKPLGEGEVLLHPIK